MATKASKHGGSVSGSGKREGKYWAGFPSEFVARMKAAYPDDEFLHQALDADDLELVNNWFTPKNFPEFRNFTPEEVHKLLFKNLGLKQLHEEVERRVRLKKFYNEFFERFYKPIKDLQGKMDWAAH